jgi:hypothetical protein
LFPGCTEWRECLGTSLLAERDSFLSAWRHGLCSSGKKVLVHIIRGVKGKDLHFLHEDKINIENKIMMVGKV